MKRYEKAFFRIFAIYNNNHIIIGISFIIFRVDEFRISIEIPFVSYETEYEYTYVKCEDAIIYWQAVV